MQILEAGVMSHSGLALSCLGHLPAVYTCFYSHGTSLFLHTLEGMGTMTKKLNNTSDFYYIVLGN